MYTTKAEDTLLVGTASSGRAASALLDLSGITKTYSSTVRALDGLDLSIDSGEFITVVGPSGCGKSTLFKIGRAHV